MSIVVNSDLNPYAISFYRFQLMHSVLSIQFSHDIELATNVKMFHRFVDPDNETNDNSILYKAEVTKLDLVSLNQIILERGGPDWIRKHRPSEKRFNLKQMLDECSSSDDESYDTVEKVTPTKMRKLD